MTVVQIRTSFEADRWRSLMALPPAAIFICLDGARVMWSQYSWWLVELLIPLSGFLAGVASMMYCPRANYRSRAARIAICSAPIVAMLLAHFGWHLLRDIVIARAEVTASGIIAETKVGMRYRRWHSRAEFSVGGKTYSTGWHEFVPDERMPAGSSATVRYYAHDPRIAEIVVEP